MIAMCRGNFSLLSLSIWETAHHRCHYYGKIIRLKPVNNFKKYHITVSASSTITHHGRYPKILPWCERMNTGAFFLCRTTMLMGRQHARCGQVCWNN